MAEGPLWQVSDQAEKLVVEVRRWSRAWRHGRRELALAMVGFLLFGAAGGGLGAFGKQLRGGVGRYAVPMVVALAAVCLVWAVLKPLRQPVGPPAPPPESPRVLVGAA